MINYSFGSFTLHDNVNYFVEEFDISPVDFNVTTAKVARADGQKKVSKTVDVRQITMTMSVLASSRANLDTLLDALMLALNTEQQNLVLHGDGRYFIADCIKKTLPIKSAAYAILQLTFQCYFPYAFAASTSTYNIAQQTVSASPIVFNVTAGGNARTYPQIHIVCPSGSPASLTGLTIYNTTQNTVLIPTLSLAANEYLDIICDPMAANGFDIYKNGLSSILYDWTGMIPWLDPTTDIFTIAATANSALISGSFTWTPRYLD